MQHDRGLEGWKRARKRQYDPLLTSRIPPQSKRCQKRKCKHSSEKENTPAWQSQQSGTEFLSQVTDEDREVLRVLKEDESHRSFEMMTERRLKEVVPSSGSELRGSPFQDFGDKFFLNFMVTCSLWLEK